MIQEINTFELLCLGCTPLFLIALVICDFRKKPGKHGYNYLLTLYT